MSFISLKSVLNATPLPQIIIDHEARIALANPPAMQLLGKNIAARHYVAALRQPGLIECIEKVQGGELESSETSYRVTGAFRESVYRVVVGRISFEDEAGLLVSFLDTTDLQDAGTMRRDFVANVSHELRTPLTALLGFIETLRGAARDDPEARDRFLGIMEREAGRMNRLIKDLLSLSRVESEERVRPRDCVDVGGVVRSVASSLKPLAEDADVTVSLRGVDSVHAVEGDPDQLAQVFSNLLENAIKYGPKGADVTIEVEGVDHDPLLRQGAVRIIVSDNGEGFDPVHIPRLTERFYRVDNHRSREMGGTGLGLAIVKHIVNRHRGHLRIESEPGKGSRFMVTLPGTSG